MLVRGAAWSIPVIVVAAPAPAMAASGGTGGISGACGAVAQGSFVLNVTGSSSPLIQVVIVRSGAGTFAVVAPAGWTAGPVTADTRTYFAPVVGGVAQGTATVTFTLPQNGTATATATISATSGQVISGTIMASVTKNRDGNSTNYACSVT